MKSPPALVLIAAVVAGTFACVHAATNEPPTAPTAGEIAAARTPEAHVSALRIATNTPAFDEYGFNLMLRTANEMLDKWKLDRTIYSNALTLRDVNFKLTAEAGGISGSLSTKDNRYVWGFVDNRWSEFADVPYCPQSFRYNDDESARLAKIKSKITAKEAKALARKYLHALGMTEKQLRLIEPPKVNQYKFEESDGTVYPLPMFNVAWSEKERPDARVVVFNISGITGQVAKYLNAALLTPRAPIPTNYADMLNVGWPTNDLQKRGLRPWPPK